MEGALMAQRKLHKNPQVNLRKFAADERKASEQGYVVKYGNGTRKYFMSYRDARKFRDELVKLGYWKSEVKIINIARQRDSLVKVKHQLVRNVGGRTFAGAGLTANELALMVLGRMCEATSHTFRCAYPTMEMRIAAQRALRIKVRREGARYLSDDLTKALTLKLHVAKKKGRKTTLSRR